MIRLKSNEILVLRTCEQDMTSYNGFKWKKKGVVTAHDWEPTYRCGNGLHGLPWGQGGDYLYMGGIWLVLKVDTSEDYITGGPELTDKCKFRTCTVVYAGTREEATQLIYDNAPNGTIVFGLSLTGGDRATLTGGDWATLTWRKYDSDWKIDDGHFYRLTTVYVGENGIKPNTAYELVNGEVIEAS